MDFLRAPSPLPPTRKRFHDDAYLAEGEATVLHVDGDRIVLDETIFYAESGGQVADRGLIDDVPVLDVQKTPGKPIWIRASENPFGLEVPGVQVESVVVHRVARPDAFEVGQRVRLAVDWPHRYATMRNHSASHFLFLAVREVYERLGPMPLTKGCVIHDESSRFDYFGKLDPAALPEVAALANGWIAEGRDVVMTPDARTPEISYWQSGPLVVPCGGTHVRSARELAPIRVKRQTQGKSVDRVYAFLTDVEPTTT